MTALATAAVPSTAFDERGRTWSIRRAWPDKEGGITVEAPTAAFLPGVTVLPGVTGSVVGGASWVMRCILPVMTV